MDTFFSEFAKFTYKPTSAPEEEFQRLQKQRGWKEGSKAYNRARRSFLTALTDSTNSPVHEFFTKTYSFLSYDPTGHPKHEFLRLAEHQKWRPSRKSYKTAEEAFQRAFEREFGSRVMDFFEQYEDEGFEYDPREKAEVQLQRLKEHFGWERGNLEWRNARDEFYDAVHDDFNKTFGTDDDDIIGWQFLCKALGLRGVAPETAEECREVVQDKHVNIYDLLEFVRQGCPTHISLRFFETVEDLSDYSYNSVPRKIYPRDLAYKGALKYVLRVIAIYQQMG